MRPGTSGGLVMDYALLFVIGVTSVHGLRISTTVYENTVYDRLTMAFSDIVTSAKMVMEKIQEKDFGWITDIYDDEDRKFKNLMVDFSNDLSFEQKLRVFNVLRGGEELSEDVAMARIREKIRTGAITDLEKANIINMLDKDPLPFLEEEDKPILIKGLTMKKKKEKNGKETKIPGKGERSYFSIASAHIKNLFLTILDSTKKALSVVFPAYKTRRGKKEGVQGSPGTEIGHQEIDEHQNPETYLESQLASFKGPKPSMEFINDVMTADFELPKTEKDFKNYLVHTYGDGDKEEKRNELSNQVENDMVKRYHQNKTSNWKVPTDIEIEKNAILEKAVDMLFKSVKVKFFNNSYLIQGILPNKLFKLVKEEDPLERIDHRNLAPLDIFARRVATENTVALIGCGQLARNGRIVTITQSKKYVHRIPFVVGPVIVVPKADLEQEANVGYTQTGEIRMSVTKRDILVTRISLNKITPSVLKLASTLDHSLKNNLAMSINVLVIRVGLREFLEDILKQLMREKSILTGFSLVGYDFQRR